MKSGIFVPRRWGTSVDSDPRLQTSLFTNRIRGLVKLCAGETGASANSSANFSKILLAPCPQLGGELWSSAHGVVLQPRELAFRASRSCWWIVPRAGARLCCRPAAAAAYRRGQGIFLRPWCRPRAAAGAPHTAALPPTTSGRTDGLVLQTRRLAIAAPILTLPRRAGPASMCATPR